MTRLLLMLENRQNRTLLANWLTHHYQVIQQEPGTPLVESFDVCLVDGPTLDRRWAEIQAHKTMEDPIFLPVILLTSYREVELITRHLWKTIDELIRLPVEKTELQARVEMLVRTRELSLALKLRNNDLESFFHAMTHDLRAPLRAIKGFAEFLNDEEGEKLTNKGQRYLSNIRTATGQMQEIIDGLVAFARVGYSNGESQEVDLQFLVERCIQRLSPIIEQQEAQVTIEPPLPIVEGQPFLLKMAITNLLSNALKFIKPGDHPNIHIRTIELQGSYRLEVEDHGIGISSENQASLFQPFTQFHGIEEYEGIGLGLATVRKAVDLMGGHVGVRSVVGQGSVFWMELRSVTKGEL
ncbi:sensor histidine kinase [Dictyobacter kobayashii]|uniref:histidine kinase n=1 Tax=Dictyobacter kobayashii TaxID=2014872 RepID=A0A402AV37_9CHLR|nr:HAMP domain-containing sensor histidine kinase [Dictyobacter kobayashii]GCE22991.1 hypothetical protein KDK_67910 [Dictyobacter kobayashii]